MIDAVKSARRVIEILECFATARRPLKGTEIAILLGYPKSSTNGLLHSLVGMGYLEFNEPAKAFFPTVRVSLLGDWLSSSAHLSSDLVDAAMAEIETKTGETVTLSVRAGLEMVFVRVVPSRFPIRLHLPVGTRAPLFTSSVGLSVLASLSEEELDDMLKRGRVAGLLDDLEETRKRVAETSRRGCAVAYGAVLEDTAAISIALFGERAGRMALGIGGPVRRVKQQEREIVRLLIDIDRRLREAQLSPPAAMKGRRRPAEPLRA